MTIESTAPTQARHKPRAQKRSANKQRLAQVQIVSDPGRSIKDFPDKDGDWWFFRVEHLNSGCQQWTINCREWQRSWVLQQQECNVQLQEGFHFSRIKSAVQVENGWETRHVLDEQFALDEPEPEQDPPMTWAKPGNEVPVVQNEKPKDPPKAPPADPEVMRRIDTWLRVLAECGVEPSHDRIAETAAGFCTSVEISKERRGNR
tara:strand:+ start:2325 stop:2936 length:612 start_codon:yes stop_codon:yes gene_type:complete